MMLVTSIVLCLIVSVGWAQTCPSNEVGFIQTESNSVRQRQPQLEYVYMNTDDPAPCSGIVYAWHYCSYPTSGGAPFQVLLAMYHRTEDDILGLVNGSLYNLTVEGDIMSYTCQDVSLDPSEQFVIQQGDMVAACWSEDVGRVELFALKFGQRLANWPSGLCFQESMSTSEVRLTRLHTLLLSAYINVNECELGMDTCHENATCSDVVGGEGSFNCTCNTGYMGNGSTCIKYVVECSLDMDVCGDNAACVEYSGGSHCVCNTGYTGDGQTCTADGQDAGDEEGGTGVNTDSKRSDDKDGLDTGAVAAIVVVLFLLALAVAGTGTALVLLYCYRLRMEVVKKVTNYADADNKICSKQHEEKLEATPMDYEVPTQGQQHENIYELEPGLYETTYPSSEEIYETVLSPSSTADQQNTKVQSFPELPPEYSGVIQQENVYESPSQYQAPAREEEELYAQISSYKIKIIPRDEIELLSHLGSGQFGSVDKGVWRSGPEMKEVAVKTLTDSVNTVKFLQEAAIMAQFSHPNVLTLHGVVSKGDPKMIVVELMHSGDLKEVVTEMRPDPGQLVQDSIPKQLLNFSKQVALGLHYLAFRGFVHRDLAARNILVSKSKECKIADFGMSRDLADDDIYVSHGGIIPVRWTAPEAVLYKQYSTASDVWSYGCVLYEIWSLGHKPFETVNVRKVPAILQKGYRLPPPPGCPKKIYELMIQAWHPDPSSRPGPRNIVKALAKNVNEALAIPAEDVPTSSQAAVLGAPLEAATDLYPHLQNSYS